MKTGKAKCETIFTLSYFMLDNYNNYYYNKFRIILKGVMLMTKYEKQIYEIVNKLAGHLTADQIFAELKRTYPSVSLATVYNNLNKLCEAGLIRRVSVEGSPDRYDRTAKHDHLVCSRCGKLKDICFEDLTSSLREQLGEEFFFYDLKVFYICPECQAGESEVRVDTSGPDELAG